MQQRPPTKTSRASAPGKIILFGEHFVVHGTGAILAAVDLRARAVARLDAEPRVTVETPFGSEVTERGGLGSRLRSLVRAANSALDDAGAPGGMVLSVESDIPSGMGLGSSSAACVAAAGAARGLFGKPGRKEVLRAAIEAERAEFPRASGADSAVSVHGGVVFFDGSVRALGCSPRLVPVIVPSSSRHRTAQMVADVYEFKERQPDRFARLCELESRILARAEPMLESGDAGGLAELMRENHEYLREMGASTPELDDIVKGMGGGKLTGAGGGGCAISVSDGPAGVPGDIKAGVDMRGLEVF